MKGDGMDNHNQTQCFPEIRQQDVFFVPINLIFMILEQRSCSVWTLKKNSLFTEMACSGVI